MDLSNQNVIHKKSNGLEYLQFKILMQYPEITHAYILGLDKNFKILANPQNECEKNKNELAKNDYKKICKELNLNYNNIVNTNQKHTDNIQIINKKINDNEPDFNMYANTDGLITNKKDIILSTINADCILLLFYDPVKKVIANVHSGWRGTLQRISVKTVEKMKKEFNCNPQDIICCMSPCIGKDHFEVDEDVYSMFLEEFTDLKKNENEIYKVFDLMKSAILVDESQGMIKNKRHSSDNNLKKYYIDTVLINHLILEKAGLVKSNIVDSGICSVCNKDIVHSYRAEGENYKLSTQVISLKRSLYG